ncbi:MAG: winged helix-turn-helix domain-containing protein [Candidatus Nitrosopumilus sp. bin_68KS]
MQVLDHVLKIEDIGGKDNILEVVADKYCRAILDTTMYKPKSVMEIAIDAKIPLSTVYRRIQMLEEQKLLWISGEINAEGKKLFLYKSKIRGIKCNFKDGQIEVEIMLNK